MMNFLIHNTRMFIFTKYMNMYKYSAYFLWDLTRYRERGLAYSFKQTFVNIVQLDKIKSMPGHP
jgi:hypothetical protein